MARCGWRREKFFFKLFLFLVIFGCVNFSSAQTGLVFTFSNGDKPLILNELTYKTNTNINYVVCQCQYFISNIKILTKDKKNIKFYNFVHYVDIEIPKTLKIVFSEDVNLQNADSLIFTFGIDSALNVSRRFKNPPENLMFWPDYLGGGYHYMKTNIKYVDNEGFISAFNCHIGRGQVYQDNKPIKYIENTFEVRLPIRTKSVDGGNFIVINLDVPTIFNYPNPVDFNDYGGIMNNQQAMSLFCKNIRAAFSN